MSHLVSLVILTATFYVVGRKLSSAVDYPDRWHEITFSCTLGMGTIASLLFVLGLMNLLTRPSSFVLIAACHLASISVCRDIVDRARSFAAKGLRRLMLVAMNAAAFMTPMLLLAFYPPTQFDATLYHLPYATGFIKSGALPFFETMRYPIFPQLQEVIFALGFMLSGEVAAQLCQTIALLLVASALVAWGKGLADTSIGHWSAAMWLGNPLAVWLGASGYIDIGLTLFVTTGILAWQLWLQHHDHRWIMLSGTMLGFACASKYLGLFFLGALGLATLIVSIRRKMPLAVLSFSAMALATAGPWYARIVYFTGNPMFPFYSGLFDDSEWSRIAPIPGPPEPVSFLRQLLQIGAELLDGLWALLLVPYNSVFVREVFNWEAPISPWLLVLIPLLVVPALRTRTGFCILMLVAAYGLFWITTTRGIRFLLPITPIFSLALAAGAHRVLDRWRRRALRPAVHLIIVTLLVAPGWMYACYKVIGFGLPPTNASARSTFLSQHVDAYDAIADLNESSGSAYTVYGLYSGNLRYFCDGRFFDDRPGTHRFSSIHRRLGQPFQLHQKLTTMGVDYLLIVPHGRQVEIDDERFFSKHFAVASRSESYLLIEVLP